MRESESAEAKRKARLRWVTLGEAIAIAALIVSAAGVWLSWNSDGEKVTTTVVEKRLAVPLALRGKPRDDGRSLEISPVESSHALQSLNLIVGGTSAVDVGSGGELGAGDFERALGDKAAEGKGPNRVRVRVDAKYVEAGADKSASGAYVVTYRWEGGGLFGGRSLRFVSFSRG
jgi:hypothetical protein